MNKTPIADLGEFALIDRLTKDIVLKQESTIKGYGDDAAVLEYGSKQLLTATALLLEGIHFSLVYTPLKHLGAKAVVSGITNILAMNGIPRQILVSVGVSSRFMTEDLEELYSGIKASCQQHNIDFVGGDISASLTGLTLNVTAIGEVSKKNITYRTGAKPNDLICISGDLGAAYLGLQILERERRIFESNGSGQPQLEAYDYLIGRQLLPKARMDMIDSFRENNIVPNSMIDITDGLASEILHLCKQSEVGAQIYLEKIPLASQTFKACEEMNIDAVTAALHGGDDFELLFTLPISTYDKIKGLSGFEIIGHITEASKGCYLRIPNGEDIAITAQGWK